jgi:mRNA interferase HigB
MRIIAVSRLREHWRRPGRGDSEEPLKAWAKLVGHASWRNPADVKAYFRSASFVGERVVFNIAGNKYRLIVWINYPYQTIYIRFIGTHAEYNRIDVETV